jgi:hypothetical protein
VASRVADALHIGIDVLVAKGVFRDLVPLEQGVRLEAVEIQHPGELRMSDESTSEEINQHTLLGVLIGVDPLGAKLLLDVLRYLEADVHR